MSSWLQRLVFFQHLFIAWWHFSIHLLFMLVLAPCLPEMLFVTKELGIDNCIYPNHQTHVLQIQRKFWPKGSLAQVADGWYKDLIWRLETTALLCFLLEQLKQESEFWLCSLCFEMDFFSPKNGWSHTNNSYKFYFCPLFGAGKEKSHPENRKKHGCNVQIQFFKIMSDTSYMGSNGDT